MQDCSQKFVFSGRVFPVVSILVIYSAQTWMTQMIHRVTRDMARKANCMLVHCNLCWFGPFWENQTVSVLLPNIILWFCYLEPLGFKRVEAMFNIILRKIWRLPANSHTVIHCTARLTSISNTILQRSQMLLSLYPFGLNCVHGSHYIKKYLQRMSQLQCDKAV